MAPLWFLKEPCMLLSVAAAPVHICADRAGRLLSLHPSPAFICVAQTPLPVPTLRPSGSLQAKEAAQKIEQGRLCQSNASRDVVQFPSWDWNSEGNGLSQLLISKGGFLGRVAPGCHVTRCFRADPRVITLRSQPSP